MEKVVLELGFDTDKREEFYTLDKGIQENLTPKEIELIELGLKAVQNILYLGMDRYLNSKK